MYIYIYIYIHIIYVCVCVRACGRPCVCVCGYFIAKFGIYAFRSIPGGAIDFMNVYAQTYACYANITYNNHNVLTFVCATLSINSMLIKQSDYKRKRKTTLEQQLD